MPAASRQIFPPAGSGVAAVIPASASPRELTTVEWPKLDWTTIGRFVLSASRSSLETFVPAGTIASWYQLITWSQVSGSSAEVSLRHFAMRVLSSAIVSGW